jgi:DNA-binding NtrC family response regulator
MKTQGLNLFIVDDNKLLVTDLKHYLQTRFGVGVNISTFYDGESCLEKVDSETQIVILDYFLEGKNGLEILKAIKAINAKTEVIMLSSNESMVLAIESFKHGVSDYIVKGNGSWKMVAQRINHILTAPIRLMAREFGVSRFVATFLFTFITMGITVAGILYAMDWSSFSK